MAETAPLAFHVEHTAFPAKSKSINGHVNGISTAISTVSFTDRILLTISQEGVMNHWVHVPLASSISDPLNPGMFSSANGDEENSLLPRTELTATSVLGGTRRDEEVIGQTLATTIASAILVKRPSENRLLLVGLGLKNANGLVENGYEELIGLILECL